MDRRNVIKLSQSMLPKERTRSQRILIGMAVPEPVSLCLHVTYAQSQTNNLGVSLNAVS